MQERWYEDYTKGTTRIKKEKKEEKCNQNWMMILKKSDIRILIKAKYIVKTTVKSKEELSNDHNDGLIIND